MKTLLLALLMLAGFAPRVCAQSLTPTSFTNFIANIAPAATNNACTSSDLIPLIQNGVTKHLPCTLASFPPLGSTIQQTLKLAGGPNTGVIVNGDLVLNEDFAHNLNLATATTVQSILFGNSKAPIIMWGPLTLGAKVPDPLSPGLVGPTHVAVYGPITMLAQTVMNGAVAMTNLPTSGGGQCLGYNTFTKQLYVSLAKC